jgi:hypothetical protein
MNMAEYSSPTKQPKYKLFWRKKDRKGANKTVDTSNILPAFEHPCEFHSSFATSSTFHESDTSFLSTGCFDDDDMDTCRRSSLSPSLRSTRNALSSIPPPPPLVLEPLHTLEPLPDHTSTSLDSEEEYAEELQEQELIALAMEMSLRETNTPLSSQEEDEDERLARLEQEQLERALQASCTDL